MTFDLDELDDTLQRIFPDPSFPPPSVLRFVPTLVRLRYGQTDLALEARAARTTPGRLQALASAEDPISELFGRPLPEFSELVDARIRAMLGQLLIGALAERVFVDRWHAALRDGELRLKDDRSARGDTDYLVQDAQGRQVFRLNIKFHGSQFRNARPLVGLEPTDCFALATYKIHGALVRQESEHLPYIFVVVGVPGLTGGVVGEIIPDRLVRLVALAHGSPKVSGKRAVEDAVVERLAADASAFGVSTLLADHLKAVQSATWRVLSARRADGLLRELLFERAYALRVRGFARNYAGAELDMHFSLAEDLHTLDELFSVLAQHGISGLVSRLERGSL